jgi:hypothetical protein
MNRSVSRSLLLLSLVLVTPVAVASPRRTLDNEVTFSVGYFEPRGSSDLWNLNERTFTVSEQDFGDAIFGARIGTAINNFLIIDVGASYYDGDVDTEYRNFVTLSGDPIEQNLRLRLLPVTATLKVVPFGRYRSGYRGSALQRVVPFFGVGGGALLWKYREKGEFVDPVSLTTFQAKFHSRGIAAEYHGVAGVDVFVDRQVSLFVEGRVSRADDDLSSDFQGFDDFDLSGTSVSGGVRIHF